MRKWTARAAQAVLVGAAFAAAGTGVASADSMSGDRSLAGGDQVQAPITAPIAIANNDPLSLLGQGNATPDEGTGHSARFNYKYRTIDNSGAVNAAGSNADAATEQKAPAAPIVICGNAMSSEGIGAAACRGHASVSDQPAAQAEPAAATCGACEAAPAQPATPAQPAAPKAPAAPPCAAKAAPKAPAQPAAPAVPPCAAKAAAPVVASAAHAVRKTAPGQLTVIRHSSATTPVAPITICGNAATLRGIASAACEGNAAFQKTVPVQHTMIGASS